MNSRKRMIASLFALAMVLAAFSAYGQARGKAGGKSGKDLVIARDQESITIDPQAGWDGASLIVLRQMYNQLLQIDDDMKIVPNLAESYTYLSGTQVQFKLRKGVKFHNGEELKASDVKFSIQRAMASSKVKAFTASITEVKVVDDYTVIITTDKPYAPLLANLCHTALSIVPEKAVTAMGDKFAEHPIGTGPFKFSEWVSGDKIVLVKHKDYFGGNVAADTLTFRTIPEGSSRTIALETGEVDMVYPVDPVDARRVKSAKELTLVETLSPKIEYVAMNEKFKPFSDVRVRRAVNYAINRQAIFDVVAESKGKITNSTMSAKIMGYTDKVTNYEYNPAKAKKLLAEAGYPNGFDVLISISGDMRNRNAQLIQSDLAAVGINAKIENLEWATFLDKVNKGDYQIFNMSYNNTTGDPDTSLYQLFHSMVPASSGNRAYYKNPKVDELLIAGRLEVSIPKRMEIYKQIQQILVDDAVWVPLYSIANLFGLRADLKGFSPHPLGNDIFDTLHY